MYSIDFTRTAEKFLNKLNNKDKSVVLNKIFSIKDNPFRFVKKLQGTRLWRLRISDYRAVIDIIIKGRRIIVLRIGHRKNVYLSRAFGTLKMEENTQDILDKNREGED